MEIIDEIRVLRHQAQMIISSCEKLERKLSTVPAPSRGKKREAELKGAILIANFKKSISKQRAKAAR